MKLDRAESLLTRAVESIAAACLLGILGLITLLVILRYAFNSGIVGANEVAVVLFVYASALGAAVELGRREHIAILFAVEKLSSAGRRFATIASFGLVAGLNLLIAWQSWEWISVTGDFLMPATQMPRSAVQLAIPIGCLLSTLYCLLGTLRANDDGASA